MKAKSSPVIVQTKKFQIGVAIEGTAPMIQNNFNQKAIEQMLRKHMGLSVTKEPKVPRECVELATIRNLSGAVCIPPTAFKLAMISASTQIKGLKKTQLRTQIYIAGKSIPIGYSAMVPRMDMVRTNGMTRAPDVRFRPMFEDWTARLVVDFSELLSSETVVDLISRAGDIGVGEWRPEKNGTFGTFRVARALDAREIGEMMVANAVGLVPLRIPDWAMDQELPADLLQRIAQADEDGEPEPE
jgi:hypothetical protein